MRWEFFVFEESIWYRLSLTVCAFIQEALISRISSTTTITIKRFIITIKSTQSLMPELLKLFFLSPCQMDSF